MIVYANGELQNRVVDGQECICFAGEAEREGALEALGLREKPGPHEEGNAGTRMEGRYGYDYMLLEVPAGPAAAPSRTELFFTGRLLLLVGEESQALACLHTALEGWQGDPPTAARALLLYFSCLMAGDAAYLEDVEEEIAHMEEKATQDSPPKGYTREISQMRRRLMTLKRYYESLFDLLEDLEENQNGFFTPECLRSLHIHTNRAARLVGTMVNLREYITQVREAYQNQLDLSLNGTMKLFTVLTAIFFPLTLIAGWYGMNLRMPEYSHPYAYPMVIGLSALVVAVCVYIFKRKDWF